MAKVLQVGLTFLTKLTTSCFYFGETLQHKTTLQRSPIYITLFWMSGLRACNKASPDIIKAWLLSVGLIEEIISSNLALTIDSSFSSTIC